jgi:hypothetical protein
VLAKSGAAVDAQPQDGMSYTADPEFGSGSELGTGNYVVYDGTGSNVSITGLTSATTYHFAIYEYNQYSCQAYLTSSSATDQKTTLTATSLMDKIYEEDKLILYPNPSASAEQISIESEMEVLSASVYTMQGNFIKDIFISNNKLVGLSDLTTGSYMILLNTEKGAVVRKVVLK